MKKLLAVIISASAALSLSLSALAVNSSISVENGDKASKPVTYTYSTGNKEEAVKSIKTLMTSLSDLPKQSTAEQTLTVTSESAEGTPVSIKLRLTEADNNTPKPLGTGETHNELGYYNINITDKDGKIVYSEDDKKTEYTEPFRDIPLGVFNKISDTESKTYSIKITVNKDNDKYKTKAEKLDWLIVSDAYTAEASPVPTVTVTAVPVVTQAPKPAENKNGELTLSAGEYVCGKDIEPDRYAITGSGKIKIYRADGTQKTTVALKNKGESSNGVEEYIINLLDGEKLVTDAYITLKPHTAPKTTASPKPSTKPKTTATPKAGTASDKTNPKTGDTAPIVLVFAVGAMSIAAVIMIEIKKRKQY